MSRYDFILKVYLKYLANTQEARESRATLWSGVEYLLQIWGQKLNPK